MCFSRTIAVPSQEELEPEKTSYVDAITNRGNRKIHNHGISNSKWMGNVCFKIDTEAEVSAVSTDAFEALGTPNLQQRHSVSQTQTY